MIDVKAIVI